jgi:cyclohexa-1,5-dienecarbonyl-CoA hydratase
VTATTPLKVWQEAQGRLLRLRLNRPKANLIDRAMVAKLDASLALHLDRRDLMAVLLDAEGPHFSYGASITEHLPDQVAPVLAEFHRLVLRMVASPVTILVAVRGQCLGGGLELAMAGHLMFVAPDASLGQPEIKLGVFAPVGSCLLPELVGPARALDLLVSGRSITATEAVAIGLAKATAVDPAQAAIDYFTEHIVPKSASSLRHAVRAARVDLAARVEAKLAAVERLYLDGLMATRDAVEGLKAFLAKRPPKWDRQ